MARKLVVAPNRDVPQPPVELPAVVERLDRIEQLLVRLIDAQPRIAYSTRQAGLQLGDLSESTVRRLVRDGVIGRVPHMGTRVVIAHHELVRVAGELHGLRAAS